MFEIDVENMHWITDGDDPHDLCAHGKVTAIIGNEKFEYNGTCSSTAIYLLKTLTEDHLIGEENQMIPCCGNFLVANETLDNVHIMGCNNGVDWSVVHKNVDTVTLITESGKETEILITDYKKKVYTFADKVKSFYDRAMKKVITGDEFEKNGYIAFWNEWERRRHAE